MSEASELFIIESEKKSFDLDLRGKTNLKFDHYDQAVKLGENQFADYELCRSRASYIKSQVLENLDRYLIDFESNFLKNGGKLIWARNEEEACSEILGICKKHPTSNVINTNSIVSQEIRLNTFLSENNIQFTSADNNRQNSGTADFSKEKFINARIGISGADFLIADMGGVSVSENEGSAIFCASFPKVHIVLAGIEKLIPSAEQLDLFWPMLAHSSTGQNLMAFNTILCGPKQAGEIDGPVEMYVIILDNGRSHLLEDVEKRQSLNCINCGACMNVCPVYKNIGSETYNSLLIGPIGSVVVPHFYGMEKFKHLSFASTLCGACTSVCPVKIDIHNLLLLNRNQIVKTGLSGKKERLGIKIWKKGMLNRSLINLLGKGTKNIIFKMLFKKSWGKRRNNPRPAPKSFNQLWKEKAKKKQH